MFKRIFFRQFTKRRYIIKFRKCYSKNEAFIIHTLKSLQEEYTFEIKKIKFKSILNDSYIIIKCNKYDKANIFMDFCIELNDFIEEVKIY